MPMEIPKKKKVYPVPIDWALDPLYADFRINATQERLVVRLDVEFPAKDKVFSTMTLEEVDACLKSDKVFDEEGFENYRYQCVEVYFEGYATFRWRYESTDFGILDMYEVCSPMLEDLQKIHYTDYRGEVCRLTKAFGVHPDPYFYEVGESEWLTTEQRQAGYRHYLLCNKEIYLEVIGKSFEWKAIYGLYES